MILAEFESQHITRADNFFFRRRDLGVRVENSGLLSLGGHDDAICGHRRPVAVLLTFEVLDVQKSYRAGESSTMEHLHSWKKRSCCACG